MKAQIQKLKPAGNDRAIDIFTSQDVENMFIFSILLYIVCSKDS